MGGMEGFLTQVLSVLERAGGTPPREDQNAHGFVLALSDYVGPVSFDLTKQQAPLGRDLGEVRVLLDSMSFRLLDSLPGGLVLHGATRHALRAMTKPWREDELAEPLTFEIHSDGSHDAGQSAWAIVVLTKRGNRVQEVKWAADRVVVDPQSPTWLGATEQGSLQAEGTGVCFAMMWVIANAVTVGGQLRSDSLCAIKRAGGEWKYPPGDKLASTARALAQTAESLGILSWQDYGHVKGHHGDPWNELADVLAKEAVQGRATFDSSLDIGEWVQDDTILHLWLMVEMIRAPAMWPEFAHCNLVDTGVQCADEGFSPSAYFGLDHEPAAPAARAVRWQKLVVATLNVQTLDDNGKAEHSDFAGRVGYLRDQFERAGVSIVALQETRSKRAECIVSGNYIRLCSGCNEAGQFGVEVWLATRLTASGIGFRPEDCTVVYWDCRTLCVRLRSGALQALVVNVHAPTAKSPEREEWWRALRQTIRRVCSGYEVLLLGDFNVRFKRSCAGRIGGLVWDTPYTVPEALPPILEEHDLWVPSTFAEIHHGIHDTWMAPSGKASARIDYVCPPCHWSVPEGGSRVDLTIDPGHRSVDHFAVTVVAWVRISTQLPRNGARMKLDRRAMASEAGRHAIKRICESIPLQPWNLDADTHFLRLQQHVCAALAKARNLSAPRLSCHRPHGWSRTTGLGCDSALWCPSRRENPLSCTLHYVRGAVAEVLPACGFERLSFSVRLSTSAPSLLMSCVTRERP